MTKEISKIAVFQGIEIRKIMYRDEWWFSVIDIVAVLTDRLDHLKARKYWNKLVQRLRKEHNQSVTNCHQLKLVSSDGKRYKTDCATTQTIFRLIQSIPSPKAEPFKLWLAKVGYERVQEIEDPELGFIRGERIYKAKGYSDDWIEKRLRGIKVRGDLTQKWQERGVKGKGFGILTAEISKATFGMTPSEYKKFKNIKKENLRDHMNDLELIFSMLGERATVEITKVNESNKFKELKVDSVDGGSVAGNARKELEEKTKKRVSTKRNYLRGGDSIKKLN